MDVHTETRKKLTDEQGQRLLQLARRTLMERFGRTPGPEMSSTLDATLANEDALKARCGTFVTLKIGGELRGCIGSLISIDTIVDGVRDNALNAAFHDPRFSPLTAQELDEVEIEISVLTTPKPLKYEDAEDLIRKLRVGVDGVILKKGGVSATFLPQVWNQLTVPSDFLGYLCLKAGLDSEAWRSAEMDVLTYQVQKFEEGD